MFEATLLITTGVLTTLLTGVFFGYAVSVNGALHTLRDDEYVRAMKAINVVIQNPLFFLSFMGPVALLPVTTFTAYGDNPIQFYLLLSATIVYIVGVFGVTVAGNVPLNERLAKSDPAATHEARTQFEKPWNRLHTIRTVAGIIATTLLFIAYIS